MTFTAELPKYRYSACAVSLWLCVGWTQDAQAACSLAPTAGNDNFTCDSGSSGPLTDLSGNNTLTFPGNGSGVITGNVSFGAGTDTVNMNSGRIVGTVNLGDGADQFSMSAGQITGAVEQGNGVDNFTMSGGTIRSLAQGDSRDFFLMTGGTITDAFEDGDTARMTAGTIGRVDMKLDDNLFDLSGGEIKGNLVTGFGRDTIIVSGGRIGGNLSVSGGNDSITVTGGEIAGEIRASAGNDTLVWTGGGIIRSAILMGDGNDTATLGKLGESTLGMTPNIDGGNGTDLLTFDGSTSTGAARYNGWETVNLNNGSRLDLDGTFRLGDGTTGTGVFNIDGSSTLTSVQGSIAPFIPGQSATLNNSGVIDLASGNSRTSDTLTVQGKYAGNGGQLFLQTAVADDNSPSDKLVVQDGRLSGDTLITVTNVGGAGALTRQNGIELVQALGSAVSDNTAFSLKNQVSAGAYDYQLFKGGVTPGSENSWYLRSSVVAPPLVLVANPDPTLPPILVPLVAAPVAAIGTPALPAVQPGATPIPLYRPEVPTWSVLPPAASRLAMDALGTFHDRQGDQRLLTDTGTLSASWGRVYGKSIEQSWAGTVSPKLDGSLKGFQVGLDLYSSQWDSGQTQRSGFFIGESRLNGDVDGFNQGFKGKRAGKVELEGKSLGGYWTLTDPAGGYLDLVAMKTWLDGENRSERGLKIDNDGHVLSLSAETGKPFPLTDDWVIEPQAQVIYQKVKLDTEDDGISRVAFDSDGAWTGRLGARLKGRYAINGQPVEPYVRANLWHTLSGTDTVTFDDDPITTRQKSSSAQVGIGVVATLAPAVSVYASADYSRNIDSNELRGVVGNLGLRIDW